MGRSTFITITLNGQGGMPPQNLSSEEAGAVWDFVTGAIPACVSIGHSSRATHTT